ncbi:hypothetical protein C1N62_08070 [Nissabacter sp. SGAir0207]|nr:hypothetical protein C1N62_08070 [Nissabacter sp. SGAir0207]
MAVQAKRAFKGGVVEQVNPGGQANWITIKGRRGKKSGERIRFRRQKNSQYLTEKQWMLIT